MFSLQLEAVFIPQHGFAYKQMGMITTRKLVVRQQLEMSHIEMFNSEGGYHKVTYTLIVLHFSKP